MQNKQPRSDTVTIRNRDMTLSLIYCLPFLSAWQFSKHTYRLSFGLLNRCDSQNMANIIMQRCFKEINLMEISGQVRRSLCQLSEEHPNHKDLNKLGKSSRMQWVKDKGAAVPALLLISLVVTRWPLWLQLLRQQKEKTAREMRQHLPQESKTFWVIPRKFLFALAGTVSRGQLLLWVYLAVPSKAKMIRTWKKKSIYIRWPASSICHRYLHRYRAFGELL